MLTASRRAIQEKLCTSVIRVYNYAHRNFYGTFYNVYYGEEILFENLTQLLLLLEEMLENTNCSVANTNLRWFVHHERRQERADIKEQLRVSETQELLATFTVKILYQENASWQGVVGWKEGAREASFRSALELIWLMDSALPQEEDIPKALAGAG